MEGAGGSARGGGSRFQANKFQYNGRVAAALIPALVVVLDYGGSVVFGTLLVGAMVTYMLDALRMREGAVTSIWATLIAANLGLMFSGVADTEGQPILLSLLVLGTCGITMFLVGVWASLQFRWLQLQYPGVVVAGERMLFGACPIAGTAVVTWGVVAAVGAGAAPFYMAVVSCVYYFLFALPQPSSFKQLGTVAGGRLMEGDFIQGHTEAVCQLIALVVMPWAYHVGTHWAVITHWVHVWSALGLLAVPVLFLSLTVSKGGLWFLGLGEWHEAGVQRFLLLSSLVCLVAAFEGRVVFHSYSQYILLHPPWSYALVTLALYCGGALVGAHYTGMIGYRIAPGVAVGFLCVCALAGGIVTGIPALVMPAPLVAAGGIALFYESRSLRDYLIFVCGALLSTAWFMLHNFWFLDIAVGGVPLRTICKLAMASIVIVLMVPGLAICNPSKGVTGILLLAQAVLVCAAEDLLYTAHHEESEGFYPGYLVLVTSAVGMLLGRRLLETGRIPGLVSWAMQCIYGGKLSVLVLPEARLLLSTIPVALAATPPLLLYKERRGREGKMKPYQAVFHVVTIFMSAGHARFAVFDVLKSVLQHRPTDGLVLGALLFFAGAAMMPIATLHFPFSAPPRRAATLTAAAGLMLMLLQPPMPVHGGAKCPHLPFGLCPRIWDDAHVPAHEYDSSAIWGGGSERHEKWPAWLLVAAVLSGLGAASSGMTLARSSPLRLLFASAMGGSAGGYVALEYFPHQPLLQLMALAAVLLSSVFLVFLQMPSATSPRSLPYLFVAVAALLPACGLVQSQLPPPPLHSREARLFADVEEDRAAESRAALLALFAAIFMLLAFALKVRVAVLAKETPAARRAAAPVRARAYMGNMPRAALARAGERAFKSGYLAGLFSGKFGPEGTAWMSVVGNISTLMCFASLLWLNHALTESSDASIFAIAPVLLLLHHGHGASDRQRYFAPVAAAASFLVVSGAAQVAGDALEGPGSFYSGPVWPIVLKNAGMLALTVPNHIMFARFLWDHSRHNEWLLLLLTPLNVPPMLLTDLGTVRALAGAGMLCACVQYFTSRSVKRSGLKYV